MKYCLLFICCFWNVHIVYAQWEKDFFVADKQALLDTIQWAETQQDSFLMGRAYFSKAHSFSKGNTERLELLIKAIACAKATKDYLCEALAYSDLAGIYNLAEDFKRAEQYYRLALKKIQLTQDFFYYGMLYEGLGNQFWRQKKQLDSALLLYDQALLFHSKHDTFSLILNYIDKAEVYRLQENYPAAVQTIKTALDLKKQQKDSLQLDWILYVAGAIHHDMGDYKSAIPYLTEGLKIAKILNYETKALHEHLHSCYAQIGNFKLAYQHALFYKKFHDIEKDRHLNKTISELRERYESERLEELNTTLEIENGLQEKTNKRQQIIILTFVIGSVLIGALMGLLWRNNRRRQEAERELNKQNIKSLEQNIQLERTRAIVQTQEIERERVAKELHDSLGGLLSTTRLYFDQLQSTNQEHYQTVKQLLDDALKETRAIAYAILPKTLSQYGLLAAIEGLVQQLNEAKQLQVTFQCFGQLPNISTEQELMLYRIVQELLNNTIKHAQASEVLIQLSNYGDTFELLYEDDGKGFDIKTVVHGMGIRNVRSRVDYLNAKLDIDSEIGIGTTVQISMNSTFIS